jgi:hypothetical protein
MHSKLFRRGQRSAVYVCLSLGLGGAFTGMGCASDETRVVVEARPELSVGSVSLALSTRGTSGTLYRLRQAVFQTTQLGGAGFSSVLFSEDDPLATTLEASLPTGDYVIDLLSGWSLEKVQNGVVSSVAATLISSPTQFFSIANAEETNVSYRFETSGDIVDFGEGRLVVEIQVEEQDEVPDGGQPPPILGEPLQVVDGLISQETNAHGIRAGLFAAAAPIGSSIEVTSQTGPICARGDVAAVLDNDFANQWGATLGFSFLSASLEPAPWDRDGGRVAGFAFTVQGPDTSTLRFGATQSGVTPGAEVHCRPLAVVSGDTVVLRFDELDRNCWEGIRDPLLAKELIQFEWAIPSDPTSSHHFDFCIDDIRPILQ